ncbi:chorismate mutase [Nostoc minutum NIES-26]|uniref:chorismate mutase n=1 Tax=Nostoc minutum NIES-26 TaxID=1844469 RepID=A0A367QWI2_9NOSO|nr:chorismate mutase [Dendronalium sp. ChiSLP03b]RCJ28061.1 chorismate mutase [Nostoc minutum NIES-26]
MEWQMRAIRGATTVSENTKEAIQEAVTELLDELERRNQLQPEEMISVTFSVTRDLDAIFPAAIARARPGWDNVAMLDVQQMHVEGSLQRCIRFLIHAYLPASTPIQHIYLRNAADLRPDWSLPQSLQASQPAVKSKVENTHVNFL